MAQEERGHSVAYILVYTTTVFVFVATLIINTAATGEINIPGLFHNTTKEVSTYYDTKLMPAGQTFLIWPVIYAWQVLWLLYGLSLLFRGTEHGKLYLKPGLQPVFLYISFTINLLSNITWLILWDHYLPEHALGVLVVTFATLLACVGSSWKSLHDAAPFLFYERKEVDLWLSRLLTQNGLSLYLAWVSVALIINLEVVLQYSASIDGADVICLALILLLTTTWFYLDLACLDKYSRHTWTPYVVFIVAITGILLNNWNSSSPTSIYTACTLAWTVLTALLKFVHVVNRYKSTSKYRKNELYVKQGAYGTLGYECAKDSRRYFA